MSVIRNHWRALVLTSFILAIVVAPPVLNAEETEQWDRSVLPIQQKPFAGHVGLRTGESILDFPASELHWGSKQSKFHNHSIKHHFDHVNWG